MEEREEQREPGGRSRRRFSEEFKRDVVEIVRSERSTVRALLWGLAVSGE
jgi:transposase-like protein